MLNWAQFFTIDWMIQWYSAIHILQGIPFYEQTTQIINGRTIWNANHLPFFFYSLAVWMGIFGTSHIIARGYMYLWIIAIQLVALVITKPQDSKHVLMVEALVLLNPFVALVVLLGLFDLVVMTFLLLTFYLVTENRPVAGGIMMYLAIFTKTFPLLLVIPLVVYQLRQEQYRSAIIFLITSLGLFISSYLLFYLQYGHTFLERTLLFQLYRDDVNTSIWYGLFGYNTMHFLPILQIVMFVLVTIVVLIYPLRTEIDLYGISGFILIIFHLMLRTSYPHYTTWSSVLMIPVFFHLYKTKRFDYLSPMLAGIVFNFAGFASCFYFCFDDPAVPSWFLTSQTLVHFVGNLIVLIYLIKFGIMKLDPLPFRQQLEDSNLSIIFGDHH